MRHAIVFFDLETGGTDPRRHPIVQLAAIAVDPEDDMRELETLEVKLRFDPAAADPEALRVNGHDPGVWAREAVEPSEAMKAFSDLLRRHATVQMVSRRTGRPYSVARLAGHNAAAFDKPFIDEWYRAAGEFLPAHPRVLDTHHLALWAHALHPEGAAPQSTALGEMIRLHNLAREGAAHEALSDVRATVALARALTNQPTRGEEKRG